MEQAEWKIMPQAIDLIAKEVRVENGKTISQNGEDAGIAMHKATSRRLY